MLSSITPLGERGRGQRWWLTVTAFGVGAVLGGALVGLVAGGVGAALRSVGLEGSAAAWTAAGLALLALAVDVPGSPLPLPRWRRQVDEDWLTRYRGWVYGFGFGLQLGLGLVTIVVSAVIYLAFALAVLSGSMAAAVAIGVAFGATKAVVLLSAARVDRPERLVAFHRRLDAARSWSRRAAVAGDAVAVALAGVAVAALAA